MAEDSANRSTLTCLLSIICRVYVLQDQPKMGCFCWSMLPECYLGAHVNPLDWRYTLRRFSPRAGSLRRPHYSCQWVAEAYRSRTDQRLLDRSVVLKTTPTTG